MQSLMIFMQSVGGLFGGNLWVLVGIVVAACVLGVEVACIAILIRKLLRAKREKDLLEEAEDWHGSAYGLAMLGAAAIPLTAETVLFLLLGLIALASVLLTVLLVCFRCCGYDFAAAELLRERARRAEAEREAARLEEARAVAEASEEADKTRETLICEEASAAEEAPTEEPIDFDPIGSEPVVEEPEESVQEPIEEPTVAAYAEQAPSAGVGGMAPIGESVAAAGAAGGPVRIVHIEKQYTETVKTVENTVPSATPAAAPAESSEGSTDSSADRLIEKLETLIDKIDRRQETAASAEGASVAVAAGAEELGEDEDEDDADDKDESSADEDDVDEEPDDNEHFTGNERIIGFDEETGCYIVAHYRKSFEAKLIQARPNIKQYYSELKNALLAYKGSKSRISWGCDSFHNGRTAIAKINVKTRILELYLALDPASLEGTVYRGHDVGHLKKYSDTPFRYKLRTPRKFKWAMELVERVCEEHGLSPIDAEKQDFEAAYPFEDTDSLVARGLIKEYIREEKPASTFELDETHVPSVPDVDETVIPANANISWEFDNEMLSQKEPEPVAESIPEPEPEPTPEPTPEPAVQEPASAPAAPAAQTVIRETTKVTQMRYTEQYYGDPNSAPMYKQYLSADEPFISNEFFETPSAENTTETVAETVTEQPTPTEESAPKTAEAVEEAPVESVEETVAEEFFEEPTEEPAEEPAEEAVEEPENGDSSLLSAFDSDDSHDRQEDDLDWGIPAGLMVQSAVAEPEPTVEAPIAEALPVVEEATVEEASAEEDYEVEITDSEEAVFEDGQAYDGEEVYEDEQAYEGEEAYEDEQAYEGEEAYEDEQAYEGEEAYEDEQAYEGEEVYEDEQAYEGEEAYEDEQAYEGEEVYEDGQAYEGEEVYEDGQVYESEEAYYEDAEQPYEGEDAYYEEEAVPEPIRQTQVNPEIALVDVSVLEANFPYGSVINLESLIAKNLVLPTAKTLKIFASGEITKAFTVVADQFSLDAIRAIDNAGGDIMMVNKR